tara:strand:- start:69 stop:2540 length:2472 start_codon:yes stop_codon:yes gene_type:complete
MYIYKKFTHDDVKINSFVTNKRTNLRSYSTISSSNFVEYHTEYASQSVDKYSGTGSREGGISSFALDIHNSRKYFQLSNLLYNNFKLNHYNNYGDIFHMRSSRNLYGSINILSIPQQTYGENIKHGSLIISGNLPNSDKFIDDKYGNLIDASFTTGSEYFKEEHFREFYLGPVEGYKLYDLNVTDRVYGKEFTKYRKGRELTFGRPHYSEDNLLDDSYYLNSIDYVKMKFTTESIGGGNFPALKFNGTGSFVRSRHNNTFNFPSNFSISFYINPHDLNLTEKEYIISKSTTKFGVKDYIGINNPINLSSTGSQQEQEIPSSNTYPFEIYKISESLYFDRNDGSKLTSINMRITGSSPIHVVCQKTGSVMELYYNGIKNNSISDLTNKEVFNLSNLYIGTKGNIGNYFRGNLSQVMIFSDALNQNQINNLSQSIDNTPVVGNVFHSNGLVTATKPNYDGLFKPLEAAARYYPLNGIHTSSLGNHLSGSFLDLSTRQQSSSGYFKVDAPVEGSTTLGLTKTTNAVFETVTHNNFTGDLMTFSSSLSSSINKRGREFVQIPNYEFDRRGKWAVSWLMKEAAGYHGTASAIMGQDTDSSDQGLTTPNIWLWTNAKLRFRDKSGTYFTSQTGITNRSASGHYVINYDGTDQTAAKMTFYENGNKLGSTIEVNITGSTNSGSFMIEALGSGYLSGTNTYGYSGSLGQVMFFDHMLTSQSIQNLNNNPTEGINPITNIQYRATHTINENEFYCTIKEEEFNFSNNVTLRNPKTKETGDLISLVTSSLFRPYITTIGLYDDNYELLATAKFGQPIQTSNETDTTFVVRWDT